MATKDEELQSEVLKEAIAGTEREIWGDATGLNPDHTDEANDRSVEEMGTGLEGQQENDADDETEEVEAKADGEDGDGEKTGDEEAEGKDGEKGDDESKRDLKTGQFKAKDGDKTEGADGKGKTQQSEESQEQGTQGKQERIPLKAHIEERKARQDAERERDELRTRLETTQTTHQTEMQAVNQRLDNLMVAISQGKAVNNGQVEGDKTGEPSLAELLIENPDAYHERIVADVSSTMQKQFVGNNIAAAVEDDADGSFQKAYTAFIDPTRKSDPQHVALVQSVYRSGNPSGRITKWFKGEQDRQALSKESLEDRDERIRRETAEKLDSDPEFRKKYRPGKGGQQREQQQVAEGQQQEAQQSGAKHVTRMPKSLNGASGGQNGGGGNPVFNSGGRDKDIFNDVMSDK